MRKAYVWPDGRGRTVSPSGRASGHPQQQSVRPPLGTPVPFPAPPSGGGFNSHFPLMSEIKHLFTCLLATELFYLWNVCASLLTIFRWVLYLQKKEFLMF